MHTTPEHRQPSRAHHLANAIGAWLTIVWEMQTRFHWSVHGTTRR
ncbi:hypothetical protein ACIQAL_26780 [Pseudomonas sp. NPDC088368]|jgi:hypothetical protein